MTGVENGITDSDFTLTTKLTDDQLRAIGTVVVQWSTLENLVYVAFALFFGISMPKGRLIAAHLQRTETLLSIIKQQSDIPAAILHTLDEIASEIETLNQERNQIVHRFWFRQENVADDALHGFLETRVKERIPVETTTEAIDELATRIQRASAKLTQIMIAYSAAVESATDSSSKNSSS